MRKIYGVLFTACILVFTDVNAKCPLNINIASSSDRRISEDKLTGDLPDVTAPTISLITSAAYNCPGSRTVTASITDVSGVPTSGIGLPVLFFKINAGGYTATPGVSIGSNQYTFTFGTGTVAGDAVSFYIVAQDNFATPNVGSNPSAGAGGFTANPPAATIPPSTPFAYNVTSNSLSGPYNIGVGGSYTTLTAAVGAYNTACLAGPVIFNLTDAAYPSETFPITINANPGASTTARLTIKPASGITLIITGSNAAAIIKINGGDFIIIDGSNNGTNTKNMTIENTNTSTASAVVWLAATPTDGATNNTVKNTITKGNGSLTTLGGIIASGSVLGSPAEVANTNTVITNNTLTKSQYGISVAGSATAQSGTVISDNTIGSAIVTDYIGYAGVFLSNANAAQVKSNNIFNISTTAFNPIGIDISAGVINSRFDANLIDNVKYTGTSGFGGKGINVNTGTATSNDTLSNNMVSNIGGDGWSNLLGDAIVGIRIGATGAATTTTGGIFLYHNTVNLLGPFAGNANGTASAALYLSSTATGIDLKDNILVSSLDNTNAADKTWAINSAGTVSGAPPALAAGFTANDYNDYSVSGSAGMLGFIGGDRAALGNIQIGFGGNINSKNVMPVFTSASDLHLNPLSGNNTPLDNSGTSVLGITTDFDGQMRNAATPDIGADEFTFGVLAVGVEYFRGTKVGKSNLLDWKVNCSTDSYTTLVLERSADGRKFKSIQEQIVSAILCTQGFSYTDAAPPTCINYYRLKTISPDGAFRYSVIVALINKDKGFELISVAPNPVRTTTVLSISSVKAGKMMIAVSDMTCKMIMTENITVIAGNNPIIMNFATLGAGTYNIKVINAGNEIKVTRFMKY